MLEGLFGSINRERVLMFLYCRNEGYAREIARFYDTTLNPIQKQLDRLENNGLLISKSSGKTRVYALSPRYPFLSELRALLEKALSFYPTEEKERLVMARQRPRRKGKPLLAEQNIGLQSSGRAGLEAHDPRQKAERAG